MTESLQRSNSRAYFNALICAMWLALPFTAFRYWSVWDRLPAHMATHFGADGRPNGWMSPQQSVTFSLTMLGVLLVVFTTILLYASRRSERLGATSWSMLALFCVVVGVFTYISDSVLQYNLSGAEIPLASVAAVLLGATVLFVFIFVSSRRGSALPAAALVSEETHASRLFALICAVPSAFMVAIATVVPALGLKLTLWAAALVTAGCAAMAWDGFHYLFSPAGIEIRTLGFRLRSIPAGDIRSYSVDRWTAAGGYGIRGVGNTRAYVWTNTGVRINTTQGEVFLGHGEPGRIVHDLDLITHHQGQESTQRV